MILLKLYKIDIFFIIFDVYTLTLSCYFYHFEIIIFCIQNYLVVFSRLKISHFYFILISIFLHYVKYAFFNFIFIVFSFLFTKIILYSSIFKLLLSFL